MIAGITVCLSKYFDYPLEQGLRQLAFKFVILNNEYFDYPLEQGLRHCMPHTPYCSVSYFDYPLEQGLRHLSGEVCFVVFFGILIIH